MPRSSSRMVELLKDDIPTPKVRDAICQEHQYFLFHQFLLEKLRHTKRGHAANPPYAYRIDWTVRGVSRTSWVTSMSGPRMNIDPLSTWIYPPKVPPVFCGAVRGTATSRTSYVPLSAASIFPGSVTSTWVFAWPGLYSENLNPFFSSLCSA